MAHIIAYSGTVLLFLINTLSPAVAARSDPSVERIDTLSWYDTRHLDVEGKGWIDTKSFYDRLPAKAEAVVDVPRVPAWFTLPSWDDGSTILLSTLVSPETVGWSPRWRTFLPNSTRPFMSLTACRI